LSLYEEQKEFLFRQYFYIPEDEILKKHLLVSEGIDEIEKSKSEDILSIGQYKKMKEILKAQGKTDDEIKKMIGDQAKMLKEAKIKMLKSRLKNA